MIPKTHPAARSRIDQRSFLRAGLAAAAGVSLNPGNLWSQGLGKNTSTTQTSPEGFFTLGKRKDRWWLITPDGKPVLLADAAGVNFQSEEFFRPNSGTWYAETLEALHQNPGCIGFHLCGAYQRNKARRRGLLDERENPDIENVALMKAANEKISQWMEDEF